MNGITNLYSALIPAIIGWLIALTGTYNAGLIVLIMGFCNSMRYSFGFEKVLIKDLFFKLAKNIY